MCEVRGQSLKLQLTIPLGRAEVAVEAIRLSFQLNVTSPLSVTIITMWHDTFDRISAFLFIFILLHMFPLLKDSHRIHTIISNANLN